jgi:hypothetical protein
MDAARDAEAQPVEPGGDGRSGTVGARLIEVAPRAGRSHLQ